MPELPEVQTVRRGLERAALGRRISRARLIRPDICTTETGRRARPADLLAGQVIAAMERRGKQLALVSDAGRVLVIHLGMSGQLLALAPGERPRHQDHIHAAWDLDDGTRIVFRDPRRFGGLWALASRGALAKRWSALGPDALQATGDHLQHTAGRSARAIKAVLLDQAVIAGVGNIYADEALFRACVSPRRPARRIRRDEWVRLAAAVRETLRIAIAARGSTLRDYLGATGEPGAAQSRHQVYGRAGESCVCCAGPLRGIRLVQRATVYCPRCQR